MKNILHIDCSPRPESHSRQLSAAIVKKILEVAPGASISREILRLSLCRTPRPTMRLPCRRRPRWPSR